MITRTASRTKTCSELRNEVQAREEILALVAHDLRNPLNVVSSAAQMLLDVDVPVANQRRLLGAVARAAKQMDRMVEDLLEIARIDAGLLSIEKRDVLVQCIVEPTIEMFAAAAAEKRIRLRTSLGQPDLRVHADCERMVQALANVVGNAVKFVEPGGTVCIRCDHRGDDVVMIAVSDTGAGVTPDQLERLFDGFWQGHARDRRGLGLGLSIARAIVEAHGGQIWAESTVGVGSTFYLVIPRVGGAPPQSSPIDGRGRGRMSLNGPLEASRARMPVRQSRNGASSVSQHLVAGLEL